MDEGVIKFYCHWTEQEHGVEVPTELMRCRDQMHTLGLIGVYEPDGIGYGNISLKVPEGMLISGTQTGHLPHLTAAQYALVTDYSITHNSLECKGMVRASAESLTHLAFYEADPSIEAVIHIHSLNLWQKYMHKLPTSSEEVPYGTPEMAGEIRRLFMETNLSTVKVIVMGGHKEGLISFGSSLGEAAQLLSLLVKA